MIISKKWFYPLLFVSLVSGSVSGYAEETIKTHKVGDIFLSALMDNQVEAKADELLLNLSEADKQKFAPKGTYAASFNAFLVKHGTKTILVDTGWGTKLFANLDALKTTPDAVDVILLTHMHPDHIGGMLDKDGAVTFPKAQIYVSQKEYDYWKDKDKAKKVFDAYQDRLTLFEPEDVGNDKDLISGIRAWKAYGHTPGHTVFMVHSKENALLILGDLVHATAIQIPVPDVTIKYDMDPDMAAKTRKEIFSYIAKNNLLVAGMHIPFPGIGHISSADTASYRFEAISP